MKLQELRRICNDLCFYEPKEWNEYKVIGPDGRPISGVHIDHEKKQVILRQRNARIENAVDL